MKRIMLAVLALLTVLVPALAFSAPASAATGVVSNGIAWTANPTAGPPPIVGPVPMCTLGVVGTDSSGNKIAISAAHCVDTGAGGATTYPDGSTVFRYLPTGTGAPIGTIAYRDTAVDFVVISLFSDAELSSNGPGTRIDGVGAANPSGIHCKDGVAGGVKCGTITNNVPPTRFYSTAIIAGGDSGGPAYQGTQIIGLNRAFNLAAGGYEFVKFSAVQNAIASQSNPIGKGLVVTNN